MVVGTAQWVVLRRLLPGLLWKTRALATAAGVFVAWTLGMIPSTVLSLGADAGACGADDAVVYGLAFLMGLVLGPVLGFAQWLVLRRHFENALLWMPANALARAFGMVVVFAGVNLAAASGRSRSPYCSLSSRSPLPEPSWVLCTAWRSSGCCGP